MRGLLLAFLLAGSAQAQRVGEVGFTVDQWGGIDTQHDSARISDFDAQTAENVLTDAGRLEKRTGNVRIATILAGYPNKALREFVPASLTRYVIAHSSETVYQTDLGGTVTALSTVTAGANVDMVQALNTLIVQDGQRTPWTWNATSTTSLAGMPTCKYMEYANERVYCGNIPSQSTSRVAVSSYGSVSYFTVPANVAAVAEAPNTFDFQREDGDVVTCLKATRCGMFVGKSRSTHIIKGYDNFTFRKDVISENIGCQDDRSVQTVDGNIVWLGQDAIYSWSCAGRPEPISRDIDPIIKTLRQGSSFSSAWILNSQSDFETGSLVASGPGAPMSSILVPGSVVPSTFSAVDTSTADFLSGSTSFIFVSTTGGGMVYGGTIFPNTGFEANSYDNWLSSPTSMSASNWGAFTYGAGVFCGGNSIGSFSRGGLYGFARRAGAGSPDNIMVQVLNSATDAVLYEDRFLASANTVCDEFSFDVSTQAIPIKIVFRDDKTSATITSPTLSTGAFYNGIIKYGRMSTLDSGLRTTIFDMDERYYAHSTTFTSRCFDVGFSTPTWGTISFSSAIVTSSSLTFRTLVATSCTGSFTATAAPNGTRIPSYGRQAIKYEAIFTSQCSTCSSSVSSAAFSATTTGYYTSPLKFIGSDISSYGALDATESISAGSSITYSVRAATYAFPADNANLAWTSINNHATVGLAVSTPTYFQYRALFLPSAPESTVEMLRSQISWTEGTTSPPVSSGWKDGRYFLCATVSATATYPDTCLVRQRNGKWVTFTGFSAASMAPFNRDLIVGSGATDGYVWKILQNDVYNDDGAAIASTWISKDFMFSPNGRDWAVGAKAVNEIWLDTEFSSSTYLTVGYSVNKSTTYQTALLDAGAWGESVNRLIPFTTLPTAGKYTRIKLYNAGLDKAIKVNGYSIYGEPNPKTQD